MHQSPHILLRTGNGSNRTLQFVMRFENDGSRMDFYVKNEIRNFLFVLTEFRSTKKRIVMPLFVRLQYANKLHRSYGFFEYKIRWMSWKLIHFLSDRRAISSKNWTFIWTSSSNAFTLNFRERCHTYVSKQKLQTWNIRREKWIAITSFAFNRFNEGTIACTIFSSDFLVYLCKIDDKICVPFNINFRLNWLNFARRRPP